LRGALYCSAVGRGCADHTYAATENEKGRIISGFTEGVETRRELSPAWGILKLVVYAFMHRQRKRAE